MIVDERVFIVKDRDLILRFEINVSFLMIGLNGLEADGAV